MTHKEFCSFIIKDIHRQYPPEKSGTAGKPRKLAPLPDDFPVTLSTINGAIANGTAKIATLIEVATYLGINAHSMVKFDCIPFVHIYRNESESIEARSLVLEYALCKKGTYENDFTAHTVMSITDFNTFEIEGVTGNQMPGYSKALAVQPHNFPFFERIF